MKSAERTGDLNVVCMNGVNGNMARLNVLAGDQNNFQEINMNTDEHSCQLNAIAY